jgi:hypothetical protein
MNKSTPRRDAFGRLTTKQTVMGITVNDGLHVNARYEKFKAILHNILSNGWYPECAKWMDTVISKVIYSTGGLKGNERQVEKALRHIGFVDKDNKHIMSGQGLPLVDLKLHSFICWLRGNINWIQQVDSRKGEKLMDELKLAYASFKADMIEGREVHGPTYIVRVDEDATVEFDQHLEELNGLTEEKFEEGYRDLELAEF